MNTNIFKKNIEWGAIRNSIKKGIVLHYSKMANKSGQYLPPVN